jgi:Stigma-specific protein, Stig1
MFLNLCIIQLHTKLFGQLSRSSVLFLYISSFLCPCNSATNSMHIVCRSIYTTSNTTMLREMISFILIFCLVISHALASDAKTGKSDSEITQNHFLTKYYNPRSPLTCNEYPKVCHLKGSPGHNCCHKRCVNVKTDNSNCGKCGNKCKFGWLCCSGKCVSVMYDRSNCGGCRRKCKKHGVCRYGMCSYAS